MAEIIDFKTKTESVRKTSEANLRRIKIESLRRHFQCMRCAFRCAKCGSQLTSDDRREHENYNAPYIFCKVCYQEYQLYRKRKMGEKVDSEFYWYNREWMRVWENWLRYQESMESYRRSPEFLRLMDEVEKLIER